MKKYFLDFELPVADLEQKIEDLRLMQTEGCAMDLSEEIDRLVHKSDHLLRSVYARLSPAQVSQVARHPARPLALDYIEQVFEGFEQLHGDRQCSDDPAIVAGLARLGGQAVAVIAQQKGRETKDKIFRNFGMPKPEGYRKALRVAKLAEKFSLPVISLVDTPGAYPGVEAEERGQSEAIGRNLLEFSQLRTPIISIVIGEGGSGGALAIAVCDELLMLEYATYSVISPEGCASILWKSGKYAAEAAERLGITSKKLQSLGLVGTVVAEPLGGAHRDHALTMRRVSEALSAALKRVLNQPLEVLLQRRFDLLMSYGKFKVGS